MYFASEASPLYKLPALPLPVWLGWLRRVKGSRDGDGWVGHGLNLSARSSQGRPPPRSWQRGHWLQRSRGRLQDWQRERLLLLLLLLRPGLLLRPVLLNH